MSYWPPPPVRISVTISSEEPAYFALIVQPLCFWKGLTHWGWVYPSQAIILRVPPLCFDTPDAGSASPTASIATIAHIRFVLWPPARVVVRGVGLESRRRPRRARRVALLCRARSECRRSGGRPSG